MCGEKNTGKKSELIITKNFYRLYKNKVGWNDEVLRWCLNATKDSGMKQDFMGGFVIDEMKIQVQTTLISQITWKDSCTNFFYSKYARWLCGLYIILDFFNLAPLWHKNR